MKQKGSMTVTMSLVLLVLLSLFAAGIQSVRTVCARVQAVNSIDAGLYSLFSEYDRDLLEEYGLFFLDAGYGTGEFQLVQMINRMEYFMKPLLETGPTTSALRSCGIDGYRLASDGKCRAVQRQIVRYMKENLGNKTVEELKDRFHQNQEELSEQKTIQEQGMTEQNTEIAPMDEISPDNNPLEIVKNIRKNGFWGLVLPPQKEISQNTTDLNTMLSHRALNSGMGEIDMEDENGNAADKLLIQEYILEKLGSFTETKQSGDLLYQAEYVLGGKNEDEENLKYVIKRLVLLREAANIAYLYTDSQKRTELEACAAALSMLLLIPEGSELIQTLLAGGWAYMESLSDVKILLSGGKVPLTKDAGSWKTELNHLNREETLGNRSGMEYSEYLGILLSFSSKETLTMRCMDMVEKNIQKKPGREHFSLDDCLDAISVSCIFTGPGRITWQADRIYTYDM